MSAPLAIVGSGCRLPGGIATPEALWQLCRDGGVAVGAYGVERAALVGGDTSWALPGGYLDAQDVAGFDAEFFGVSPAEAAAIDPQQRLLLMVAWEALERAGLPPARLAALRTGVFTGLMSSDYAELTRTAGAGVDPGLAAGRISHLLGLRGPSLTVSAACASGLAALHLGCLSLRSGESDVVMVGAANLMLAPGRGAALAALGALSPDGRCRSFDEAAAGFGRAEGCAVVIVRRLDDALAAGQRIEAVIHGTALNHNGGVGGLLMPSGPAQQDVIRAAHADAGVPPDRIGYCEAHGTATPLGDAIEAAALAAVFGLRRDSPLPVGTVKANLGHTEAAAGLVALLKVVLALREREIPPLAGLDRPSQHLPSSAVLAFPRQPRPWPGDPGSRLAGVSAFSLTGANAHVVVGEPPAAAPAVSGGPAGPHLLLLSARNETALGELARRHGDALRPAALGDVCRTAVRDRAHHPWRLAIVAASATEMTAAVRIGGGTRAATDPQPPVFAFPGYGTQWPGMGAELLRTEPAFLTVAQACDEALRRLGGGSVIATLRGERRLSPDTAIPALTTLQLGLAALWDSWGVRPGAAIGVSCGEIAAACLAGVLTTEEALAVSFHLGLRLAALPPSGMLAAVARSADRAFHSPAVEPIRVGLTEDLRGLAPRAARLPLASSVTGRLEDGSALGAGSWWRVARLPFDLAGAAAAIIESGLTTFLELGPQASLGLPLQECLSASGRDGEVIASVRRAPGGPRWTLLAAAARLYELGHNVVPYQEPGPSAVLPSYPWRLDRHWVGPAAGPALAARLTAADRWQRRDTLTMAIATEVGRLLGVPAEEVDQKRGFFDLGLCSADAVALRHSLERALGFRLPPTLAFDYPTIERLADHLTTAGTGAEET